MQGYKIEFNIYADNEQEVFEARKAITSFVSELAMMGIPVSAKKIAQGLPTWKNNVFIKNRILEFFKSK